MSGATAAGREVLPTDEGGCVTKRFVIFNTPNRVPEKKGGWLKDEYLIDFLREVMLLDGWEPGFRATVLELTWDNDLWASSASEYLSLHDHAIGPRAARKAWKAAREKHERIYKAAPAAKLGGEIDSFRKRTAISTPARTSGSGGEALGRITQALVKADEEFGNSLSAYRYRKLAEAVASLSAPQGTPEPAGPL